MDTGHTLRLGSLQIHIMNENAGYCWSVTKGSAQKGIFFALVPKDSCRLTEKILFLVRLPLTVMGRGQEWSFRGGSSLWSLSLLGQRSSPFVRPGVPNRLGKQRSYYVFCPCQGLRAEVPTGWLVVSKRGWVHRGRNDRWRGERWHSRGQGWETQID